MHNNTDVLALVCKNFLEILRIFSFVCEEHRQIDHSTLKCKLKNKRRGKCKFAEKFRPLRQLSLVLCFHEAGVNLDEC